MSDRTANSSGSPSTQRDKDRSRLLAKADRSNGPDACWPFTGARKPTGYGNFYLGGKVVGAHVAAYLLFAGEIPAGLEIDHICHDPQICSGGNSCTHRRCVNPAHLVPSTHRANDMRSAGVSAINAVKTHCPRNHPYDDVNTYRAPGSPRDRHCLRCMRERRAA